MNTKDLIIKLKQQNVNIDVVDGKLKLDIPENFHSPELIDEIRESKTELIEFIKSYKLSKSYKAITLASPKDYYKLSSAQKRLYFLYEFDKLSLAYNLPQVVKLEGDLDRGKLVNVFSRLIARHESLRTSFHVVDEEPVQRIEGHVDFNVAYYKSTEEDAQGVIKKIIKPFDLSKAPLIRAGIIELSGQEYILVLDMHHIITDGVSQSILVKEFMALYNNEVLPELLLQYKDYSEWSQGEEQQNEIAKHKDFWVNEFSEETSIMELPTDFSRPLIKRYEGSTVDFNLSTDETIKLRAIAEREGTTMFMMMLSVYNILLGKLGNTEDVVIGVPTAGRGHVDLENVIGMFVNTLPLRNALKGTYSFRDFLSSVKTKTLSSFDNQAYQYEELIDELKIERNTSRNPLFEVMFVLQNFENSEFTISGLTLTPFKSGHTVSKFDLTLEAVEVENQILLRFEYSTALFKKETIERFVGYFKKIVTMIIADTDKKISEIEIITEEEKNKILYDFNNTGVYYPKEETLVSVFEKQVKLTPQNKALRYGDETISYQELKDRSDSIAAYLRKKEGIKPGNLVGLMLEREEYLIPCLFGILKTGCAYLPIDPHYPFERINSIIEDSKLNVLITRNKYKDQFVDYGCSIVDLDETLTEINNQSVDLPEINVSSNNLAYVIYTSGSTGKPKGVMIEHHSVINRILWMNKEFPIFQDDVIIQKTPIVFDVSVWELFWWSFTGASLCLLKPQGEKEPQEIINAIEKYEVTTMHFVPSMLGVFLSFLDNGFNYNKLKSLRQVFSSGEALRPEHVNLFGQSMHQNCGTKLINLYGPTEATVDVSFYECNFEGECSMVPIGKPIDNIQLYVINSTNTLSPIGVAGELCIAGVGLGRGYLHNKELTDEKFVENPYINGERIYKTGDLVKWMPDGNIEYLGRIDNQVKIRGFRIELGDVENHLSKHGLIKDTVVLVKEKDGHKYLLAYYVSESEIEVSELRAYLSAKLPDYMVPSFYIKLESIPLTQNGKVDKRALPDPEIKAGDDYVAPQTPIQRELVAIWGEVLGFESIGIRSDYFALGGDSIRIIGLVSKINKRMGVNIGIIDVYKNTTIERLGYYLENLTTSEYSNNFYQEVEEYINELRDEVLKAHLAPETIEDVYPMSDIEKGISFYYSSFKDTGIYHDQFSYTIKVESFDPVRFRKAFELLVLKHETLRCGFNMMDYREPVRLVYKTVDQFLSITDISGKSPKEQEQFIVELVKKDFRKSFDEKDYPLWRFQVCILDKDNVYGILTSHHAILDGWSVSSLLVELMQLYHGLQLNASLVPRKLLSSYRDYVIKELVDKQSDRHANFWKEELSGYQRTELPIPIQGEGGNYMKVYYKVLDGSFLEQAEKAASTHQTSLKNLCLAAYSFVLNMFSYGQEVVVGCVTNNRPLKEDGENIVGCFLNTVPVRITIPTESTWADYIRMVEKKMLVIKEHEGLSLIDISQAIGERNINRNPIFDTLLNYLNFYSFAGLDDRDYSVDNSIVSVTENATAQQITNTLFDFEINITTGEFVLMPKYNTTLFNRDFVDRFCNYFINVLNNFAYCPESLAISNSVLSEKERKQLISDFNDTKTSYSGNYLMHELFEKAVAQFPKNIAVSFDGGEISYSLLNMRSNQLASILRKNGIKPGELVPVFIERSIEMIIGMMGILKAGGAYVPVEPYLPVARILNVLDQIRPACMITGAGQFPKLAEILNGANNIPSIYCLTEVEQGDFSALQNKARLIGIDQINKQPEENLKPINTSEDIAYIIFTSGSTGTPKGVQVKHRPVINVLEWVNREFNVKNIDKLLFITSIGFDLSVYDIFGILAAGATIRLTNNTEQKDPVRLIEIIVKEGITIWDSAPAALQQLLPLLENIGNYNESPRLRLAMLSGDWIPLSMPQALKQAFSGIEILAMGGATEATIWSNYYVVKEQHPKWRSIPYGKPIQNAKYFVLDSILNLCPIGAPGDLYIGGECLASGYFSDAELSRLKFIPSPYSDGEVIYKTGDIARRMFDYEAFDEEGIIEFLGRVDAQVKVRGYRIETGDIESCLIKYPSIKDAVVVAKKSGDRENYLCAYYISSYDLDKKELTQFLSDELPEYMIPTYFIRIEKIPITSNGKLDKNSLPDPDFDDSANYVAPSNDIEKVLVEIWSEILELDKGLISVNSNFFELGGHSLKATVLLNKIHKELNVEIPLREIFDKQTIMQQASFIEINKWLSNETKSADSLQKNQIYI